MKVIALLHSRNTYLVSNFKENDFKLFFINKRNLYCYNTKTGEDAKKYLHYHINNDSQLVEIEINQDFIISEILDVNSTEFLLFTINSQKSKLSQLEEKISELNIIKEKYDKIIKSNSLEDIKSISKGFDSAKKEELFYKKQIETFRKNELKQNKQVNKILTREEKYFYIKNGKLPVSEDMLFNFKNFFFHYGQIEWESKRKYKSMGVNTLNPQFRKELKYTYRKKSISNNVYELIADFFIVERSEEVVYKLPNQKDFTIIKKPELPLDFISFNKNNWNVYITEVGREIGVYNPFVSYRTNLYELKYGLKNKFNTEERKEIFFPIITYFPNLVVGLDDEEILNKIQNCSEAKIELIMNEIKNNKSIANTSLLSDIEEILDYKITSF